MILGGDIWVYRAGFRCFGVTMPDFNQNLRSVIEFKEPPMSAMSEKQTLPAVSQRAT